MTGDRELETTLPPETDDSWHTTGTGSGGSKAAPADAPSTNTEPATRATAPTPTTPSPTTPAPTTPTAGGSTALTLHGPIPELPGFTFVRPLGTGGFSDVHLYRQHRPDRDVAVKIITGAASTTAQLAAAREGDLMAAVSVHPSIVDVYGMGETDDGRPFLVMEHCPGPSLVDRLRDGPLSLAEALSIGVRLAGALETAHHWGVVHRDVKPSNVLTNQFGAPTLTDFGIAGTARGDADPVTAVSVPWSPPELLDAVRSGESVPGSAPALAADVYALAATVWTMLSGRPPFVAEATAALVDDARLDDAGDAAPADDAREDDATGAPDRAGAPVPADTSGAPVPADTSGAPAATPDTGAHPAASSAPASPPGTPAPAAPTGTHAPPPRAAVARAVRVLPAPPTGRRDVPPALELALARGMAKRPADRFATVAEFGQELQRIEHELGLPSTTMDIPRVLPPTTAALDPDAVPVPGRGAESWEPLSWRESGGLITGAPARRRRLDVETENALLRVCVVVLSVLLTVLVGVGLTVAIRSPDPGTELGRLIDTSSRLVGELLTPSDPMVGGQREPAGGG